MRLQRKIECSKNPSSLKINRVRSASSMSSQPPVNEEELSQRQKSQEVLGRDCCCLYRSPLENVTIPSLRLLEFSPSCWHTVAQHTMFTFLETLNIQLFHVTQARFMNFETSHIYFIYFLHIAVHFPAKASSIDFHLLLSFGVSLTR